MEALVQLATAAFRPDLRAATQFHCHLFHAGSDAWGEPAGARTWDRHRAPGYIGVVQRVWTSGLRC